MKQYERVSECKNQSVDGIAACVLVKVCKSFSSVGFSSIPFLGRKFSSFGERPLTRH